jgi:hypothetical protein
MAKQKVKANWMIMLMLIGGLFYSLNFFNALLAPEGTTFEFISFQIGKWPYTIFTLICGWSLTSLAINWYKQKRNAKNNA